VAYADYTYYTVTYLGNAIAEADFPRLSERASEFVDRTTYGRAADDTDNTTAIKKAMCAIADVMQTVENDGGIDGIQSESIGSSSVTYADNSARRLVMEDRYEQAARRYLGSTGLMYKGFMSGEYGGIVAN
jgi:hypothetical protein